MKEQAHFMTGKFDLSKPAYSLCGEHQKGERGVNMINSIGVSLGFLNEYESTELRCQIAEQEIAGYYLLFRGIKFDILSNGKIMNWADGLFDDNEKLLSRLFKAQLKDAFKK